MSDGSFSGATRRIESLAVFQQTIVITRNDDDATPIAPEEPIG